MPHYSMQQNNTHIIIIETHTTTDIYGTTYEKKKSLVLITILEGTPSIRQ